MDYIQQLANELQQKIDKVKSTGQGDALTQEVQEELRKDAEKKLDIDKDTKLYHKYCMMS